ncbi:putative redox protein [Thalassobacillus cyri]|uniref:Putative redox protein n=1 Tax=Thalassobacillus cyri TaxID=571932 RepID=A0A1H3Y704_9BACI|nr:alpha/beta hydrolase [Thalassobacillus cyri]SEA07300.1 putative redox protein [Thalassobacillus cyri]
MKKISFKNSRHLHLVGELYPASQERIVIMCHGFTSDKSLKGRFDRFAKAFHRHGFSVLKFDFSGCGESDDDRITLQKEIDDLQAAISYVKSLGFTRIALYGHSLGSRVCLEGFTEGVEVIMLTGALTGPIKYEWPDHFTEEQLDDVTVKGFLVEKTSSPHRENIQIDHQMLMDFETCNQQKLLSKIDCPALIIHGDADEEEVSLHHISRLGMKWLPPQSNLEVIHGADHSFFGYLNKVESLLVDWLVKHLAP